ncbi:MAG: DUF29 family protein [Cyanobacteria bacterium P01_G01_bin.38]
MTQELLDLRRSLLEGRYEDALLLVDELEGMGKQAILRNIELFLVRLLVHLLKNQIEQRLAHSWLVSISDSILQISKLNLRDNKTSYYISISGTIRPATILSQTSGLPTWTMLWRKPSFQPVWKP